MPMSIPVQNLSKSVLFGTAFGLFFGLIDFISLGTMMISISLLAGLVSLVTYLILLYFIMNEDNLENFKKRFLAGILFSLTIGLTYGFITGIASAVFAENVLEVGNQISSIFQDMGFNTQLTTDGDREPTPVFNFIYQFFVSVIFNLFAGSIFSAIFALVISKKNDTQPQVSNP